MSHTPEKQPTLIFAYRAERGFFNTLSHTMHRVFSPETYECRLCQFTFSAVGMLRPWKEFLESRPEAKIFYHRKEFQAAFPEVKEELPLILESNPNSNKVRVLLDRSAIESCSELEELIESLERKLD